MTLSLNSSGHRRFGYWLVMALLFGGLCTVAVADPVSPTAEDHTTALTVAKLIGSQHLSRHPLDKEMSERCLKSFLKMLDPMKLYFYQSDVDDLMKHQDELSAKLLSGDVNFAYTVFQLFLKRMDERVKQVDELLAMPHDFTVDEEMIVDRDTVQYPRTPAEAQDRWRKRIKYDLLVLKVDKKDGKEAIDKLYKRYHSFAKRMHQTDGSELLEMYLNSFTTSYDPHSDYMSPRTLKNFDIIMSLELEGIGASLMSEDGYTVVKKIIPKGAADKNGQLKVEDKIVGVGQGDNGEIVDVVDMKLNDVVDLIRGKRGTVVRLDVIPATGTEPKVIRIAREKIELTDSEAQGEIFDAGQKPDGTPYRVGVIDLPSFYMDMAGARRGLPDYKSTTRDVRNILDDFKKKGVDAVVLDLRWNGGGSLTEAINLTGLFITDGPVVQVKGADGRVEPYYDLDPSVSWAGPLVVVTSKFSASASEILAGAIQDYGRGLIVGDHSTHGKGTVQSLLELGQRLFGPNGPQMGALKITQQQFYRPCGDSTQKRGVLADVELPSLSSHLDVGEADLDYPLEFDKVDTLPFKRYGEANPALCGQLRELSEQRTKNSEWFQKELRKVARYEEQKKKKTVTLNEEKFLKERAELNADKEEEKSFEKLSNANNKGIVRDDYLNEVFTIVNDYLNQTSVSKAQQAAKGPSKP
jgi:carboxyl-terminal processing protease